MQEKYWHLVWQFDDLPGYYVKWGIDRIRGMETIRLCIEEYGLDHLEMTKKYLYHIPGRGEELVDTNYWIIAEEQIRAEIPLVIDLEEAQQICTLLKETGFYDFHPYNVIRNKGHKLAIIDTEDQFNSDWGECLGLRRIITSDLFNLNTQFTEEALKHIIFKILGCYQPTSSSYKRIYNLILEFLEMQPRVKSQFMCKNSLAVLLT